MSTDLVVKIGEYTNKQGETKGRYKNIGVMLDGSNGKYILLDPSVDLAGVLMQQRLANPQKAGEKVLVSLFEKQSPQAQSSPAAPPPADYDDSDLPF